MNNKHIFTLTSILLLAIGMKAEIPYAVYNAAEESLLFLCLDSPIDIDRLPEGELAWPIDLNQGSTLPAWNDTEAQNALYITFDESFSNIRPTSCHGWFEGFSNLTYFDGLESFNTSRVTDMSSMFEGCSKIKSLTLSNFNTSSCTDMQDMFADCISLKTLDISNFNTLKVTNMAGMFVGCGNLANIYVCDKFTTASVVSSTDMFAGCTNLKNFKASSTDKTHASKGDDSYLSFLTKYPYAFYYPSDSSLHFMCFNTKLSISGSLDIVSPKKAKKTGIWEVDLSQGDKIPAWNNSSAIEATSVVIEPSFIAVSPNSISHWFEGFSSLISVEGIENLDTSSVTDMSSAFAECSSLKTLDLGNFNTERVKDVNNMFAGCESLRLVDLSWATSDCSKIVNQISENALVYVPKGLSLPNGRKNIVIGDICEHFVVNNGATSAIPNNQLLLSIPYPFTANKVTIKGSFTEEDTLPIYMPFEIPTDEFGRFFSYTKYDEAENLVVFSQLQEEIVSTSPNIPYLFIPSMDFKDGIEIVGDVSIEATTDVPSEDGFIGIYENMTFTDADNSESVYYFWTDGMFNKAENGEIAKACRAYIKLPKDSFANAPSQLSLKLEDNSTSGIKGLDEEDKCKESFIFDLNGRRVDDTFKGVVIYKGKKIVKLGK